MISMVPKRFFSSQFLSTLALMFLLFSLAACGGQAADATKAHSRAVINAGAIMPAEEVRVAEYLQYYEQHLPEPQGEAVALDLRLGNERMPAQGGVAWLQVGLQTKSAETELVAPLNLAIVIDRSGSMDAPDKMPYLKASLRVFLESLKPDDLVSLVVYSDGAELLLPAQPVGDARWVQAIVDGIQPGGGTNLHAGMILGLQEVERHFDIRRNNRVILLTDGIANQGITDPAQIAAEALAYTQKGIYLSTIGLGLEFNDALLSELARQGQGGYSFVDSAEEMDRIFREHVAGLKQRVANNVNVTLTLEPGVKLLSLTGLEGALPAGGVNVPLWPLGTGDSSIILAELQVESGWAGLRPLVRVQLSYFDEFAQQPVTVEQTIQAELATDLRGYDPTWDLEIFRNVTLQRTAEGMRQIDRLFQAGRYEEAWGLARNLEQQLNEVAHLTSDETVAKDVALMGRYQQTLAEALWQAEGRTPGQPEDQPAAPASQRPYRGYPVDQATLTPSVPVVEIR
jgi:Ca-activated chloride channel homolog